MRVLTTAKVKEKKKVSQSKRKGTVQIAENE